MVSVSRVAAAFAAVPRVGFLPPDARPYAHWDQPLPIGHGATNSQPWTVRYMLERLDVRPGERVLDVGSGSGWTTALLGWLVGASGSVLGLELEPALVEMGRQNLERTGQPWCRIDPAVPGVLGVPGAAAYDRILVSAAAERMPQSLVDQVAPGGRMVIPVADEMWVVDRGADGRVQAQATGDLFRFVPLR